MSFVSIYIGDNAVGPNEDMNSARVAIDTLLYSRGLNGLLQPKVEIESSKTPYRP